MPSLRLYPILIGILALSSCLPFPAVSSAAPASRAAGADHGTLGLDARALDGMRWRLVGPHRAGWGTSVTGIAGEPDTYYFGAAGGGIWKTLDAGRTWRPIFDQGPASIGAIAAAPSDPKVIYAGTGQVSSRYDVAAGEGDTAIGEVGRVDPEPPHRAGDPTGQVAAAAAHIDQREALPMGRLRDEQRHRRVA